MRCSSRLLTLRGPHLSASRLRTRPAFTLPSSVPQTRTFRVFAAVMAADTIDGTAIAKGVRERLHSEIQQKQQANPRFKPTLRIIQGEDLYSVQMLADLAAYT